MIQKIKKIFPVLVKILFFSVITILGIFLIKNLFANINARSVSSDDETNIRSDILVGIINKTLPIVSANIGDQQDEKISQGINALFKYIKDADYMNPKNYLASQIPMLGMYEITTFSASAGSLSSRGGGITPTLTPTPTPIDPAGNDDVPVNTEIDRSNPVVLIFHTHTTEAYKPTQQYNYTEDGGRFRTKNLNYTVCAVGEEMKKYIETYYGFAVVHDTTVHDLKYTGSYNRSRQTLENLLKEYPNVKFVIDLHRDANVPREDMIVNIGEEVAARVSFVIGQKNPHWQENYLYVQKLCSKIEELYPGLVRKITPKQNIHYNQDLSNRAMLIEIGSDVTTLEESLVTAKMVGKAIGEFLLEDSEQN